MINQLALSEFLFPTTLDAESSVSNVCLGHLDPSLNSAIRQQGRHIIASNWDTATMPLNTPATLGLGFTIQ